MCRLAFFAATFLFVSELAHAQVAQPPQPSPEGLFAETRSVADTPTDPFSAGIPLGDEPSFRLPTGPPGLFFDGSLIYIIDNLRGNRSTLPQFHPLAAWRVPALNAAELDGVSGRSGSPASFFTGLRLAAGYRLEDGWGEWIAQARWAGGSRERWFANGDPRIAYLVQNQLAYQSQDGDGTAIPPKVEPGRPDPLGASHVVTRVGLSTYDLAYGNGFYGAGPFALRAAFGGRWANLSVEDLNEGFATAARETSRFGGFGPMASVYGEWLLIGSQPFSDVSLGLFAGGTGSVLFGHSDQTDREEFLTRTAPSYQIAVGGAGQTVPVFSVEAGLAGRYPEYGLEVTVGYEFEEWKRPASVGASRFDLTMHGIFVRCTWHY